MQRSGVWRSVMRLLTFRRTGACCEWSGTTSGSWGAVGWFRGSSAATSRGAACSSGRWRGGTSNARWHSSMKWQRSYRNSKQTQYIYIFHEMEGKEAVNYDNLYIFINVMNGTILIMYKFSYRGYYSRKYEHDFYARKTYLNHI